MEQLDLLFDPAFHEQQLNKEVLLTNQQTDSIRKLDKKNSYPVILSTLWNIGMPCSDTEVSSNKRDRSVLRYCEWKGVQVPCAAIFSTFPTDQGMCCTFQMKAAEDMFSGETYPHLIQTLQDKEKYSGNRVTVKTQNMEPGQNKGLFVILDSHSDIMTASSIDKDTQGFVGLVTQGGNFPQISVGGFEIKPGHKNIVALSATVINSGQELQSMDPKSRNCYFEWESSFLKVFQNYTQQNCKFECSLFYAQQHLESKFQPCSPWYFPSPEMSPNMCDPWQAAKMIEIMSNVPISECKHCLSDCNSTIYKHRISTTPFRNCQLNSLGSSKLCNKNLDTKFKSEKLSILVQSIYNKKHSTEPYFYKKYFPSSYRKYGDSLPNGDVFESTNKPYNSLDKDLASVQIFFDSAHATKIQRSPKMTWTNYFSNVGGVYGLVLGMGIISLFEILWFLI